MPDVQILSVISSPYLDEHPFARAVYLNSSTPSVTNQRAIDQSEERPSRNTLTHFESAAQVCHKPPVRSHPFVPRPVMAARDPITTHVLDSTTGRPAAGVKATLTLHQGTTTPSWTATTSANDGRINNWEGSTSLTDLTAKIAQNNNAATVWSLRFDTESYWGGADKTFYPEVEIRFFFNPQGGHYHVPLLLGPWGYTTYRGS